MNISISRPCLFVLCALFLLAGCRTERPIAYQIDSSYTVNDPQFTRAIGSLLGPLIIAGNSVKTLRNGDEIFPAMLDAIHNAQHSVTFETYIYWSGDIGEKFATAFAERAMAGVKVKVLIDWYGGGKMDAKIIDRMKNAGVELHRYHPFHIFQPETYGQIDHRTHRKTLVVDGKIGFTGGVGIADVWLGNADRPDHWRDNHYRVEGPVVSQLQAAFADNWMQTTGVVLDGDDYFPELHETGQQYGQVFRSASTGGSENMQLLMLMSIDAAGHTIRAESAYFVPDELTRRSLIAAAKRGVKIQIIVPGPNIDEEIVRRASRSHWGELLKAGIEIDEYQPTMLHCKQLIIDDRWVSIGSSNMDNRSFRLNDEANLNVLDHAFAAEQTRIFEEDLTHTKPITYEQWAHRPLAQRMLDGLATVFDWEL